MVKRNANCSHCVVCTERHDERLNVTGGCWAGLSWKWGFKVDKLIYLRKVLKAGHTSRIYVGDLFFIHFSFVILVILFGNEELWK